jgi:hypothetical protein
MKDTSSDLEFYLDGVGDLEEYLLSKEIYWNLPGLPRLTIGNLLLTRIRLINGINNLEDLEKVKQFTVRLEKIRAKWKFAWENKIKAEIGSRITLWENYLADYQSDPVEYSQAYYEEVRWRVIIQLLSNELSGNFKEDIVLKNLDEKLRIMFIPGSFIWSNQWLKDYPSDEFWFLYGQLHGR